MLEGTATEGCRPRAVATEAGVGNMEIDRTDFHIPAAATTATRCSNLVKPACYGIRILRARSHGERFDPYWRFFSGVKEHPMVSTACTVTCVNAGSAFDYRR